MAPRRHGEQDKSEGDDSVNEKNLNALIQRGEGQTLEFKLRPSENIGKTLCAFANTNDGVILVGLSDAKEIVGISTKMESQIASIAHSCKPSIFPKITAIAVGDKAVLSVEGQENQRHPFR